MGKDKKIKLLCILNMYINNCNVYLDLLLNIGKNNF